MAESAPRAQPYSKAERLLNLLMALRASRVGLSREQIRARVRGYDASAGPAFERRFERDKDELRAMGVPLVTLTDATGNVTGYRVQGAWTLPPLELGPGELAVLGLAARMWQGADLAPAATNALRKVEARLGIRSAPASEAPVAGLVTDTPLLPGLIEACTRRQSVTFGYRKPTDPEPLRRHVQPWAVVLWQGHWYLVGNDVDRGEQRVFRASRISGPLHVEDDQYEVPAGFEATAAVGRFEAESLTELHVAVEPGAAASLRRAGSATGALDDGATRLVLRVHDLAAGVAEVLAHAPRARVIAPPEALDEARHQLESILAGQGSEPADATPAGRPGPRGTTGSAQFERLLALVPWLAANSGVSVEAAAAHFGVTAQQLLADLGSIITSGSDDWHLFDIQYWDDDGVIRVIDALDLAEPLTLTPDEAFALLAALEVLAAVPGSGDRQLLTSTRRALTTALSGSATDQVPVAVRLEAPDEVVDPIRAALGIGRALELTYLGGGRDEVTERVVDPAEVVVIDGYAYLRAWCRNAQGMRLFRLDRVLQLRVSEQTASDRPDAPGQVEPMAATLATTGRTVVVDVPAGSAITERHPVLRRWQLADGGTRAELPVGDYAWARRLVLGGAGEVILREPAWLAESVVEDASQALAKH